jgi:hypothetical protein
VLREYATICLVLPCHSSPERRLHLKVKVRTERWPRSFSSSLSDAELSISTKDRQEVSSIYSKLSKCSDEVMHRFQGMMWHLGLLKVFSVDNAAGGH